MNHNYEISMPIVELLTSQNEEIAKYKWLESQRLGYDIGIARASEEWFDKYFADWVRDQRRLIDEALSMTDHSLATSDSGVQELQPQQP